MRRLADERVLVAGAAAVYVALGAVLVAVGPGPGYDETLFHAGAVHLLTGHGAPAFAHSPAAWVPVGERSWPLMIMPYAGAVSFYLLLPVFALFGTTVLAARVAAVALGAFGIWGVARLAGAAAGRKAAAASALVLAVHPGYVSNTVFNDSGFGYWIAAAAVACLALRRYLARPGAGWAAAVGLACGLALWTRLNFAFLLVAAVIGALCGFGRRALPPRAHVAAGMAGALVGSAPLLVYLVRTRARETLAFMASHDAAGPGGRPIARRVGQLAAALLYDFEHRRGLWEGPPLPAWQVAFIAVVVACGVLAAFGGRDGEALRRWHRAVASAAVVLAAIMVWSRLPIREHHLLTVVPLAAVAVVLAAARLLSWRPAAWPMVAGVAVVYLGVSLSWQRAAWVGLTRTGGGGQWSDATLRVADYLDHRNAASVTVFDWGFHNSIYVATAGRVKARELFWYDPGAPGAPVWRREIVPGGVYLTHFPPYLQPLGAGPTARFRQALARSGLEYARVVFRDRRGRPHTELIEVLPSR